MRAAVIGLVLGLVWVTAGVVPLDAQAPPTITVPPSIASDCSANVTGALGDFFKSVRDGSTVSMGDASSCYKVNGTLRIEDQSFNIEGNGATLRGKGGETKALGGNPHWTMLFGADHDMVVSDLNLTGGLLADGSNGGAAYEGYGGLETISSKNMTFSGVNLSSFQGDCLSVQFASPATGVGGNALNRNVLWQGSKIKGCGWVGLSVEAVDGLRVSGTQFSTIKADAMDFEYDLYSSSITKTGQARGAAQDDVTIDHDNFFNWGADWFASLQGQTKCQRHPTKPCAEGGGVQERNVELRDNTLNAGRPLIEVEGTNPAYTPEPYWFHGLVVTGNVNKAAARPIHGGAITGSHVGVAIAVANVVDATISANTFPLFHGTPAYHPNTPYFDAIKPSNVNGLDITHDDFSGAQSVVHGARGNADVTRCENTYELDGRTDGPCPVSVLPPA